MSSDPAEPTEAELRAAWEEQLRQLTPADLIAQTAVSLINLGGRRLGLDPGTEAERDLEQVRDAIDAARALVPVLERREPADAIAPLRDALSALQLHYARLATGGAGEGAATGGGGGVAGDGSGGSAGGPPDAAPDAQPGPPDAEQGPGPAQRSGRLWVPGS